VNRGAPQEAVTLGLAALAALGFPGPQADVAADVARRMSGLRSWIDQASVAADSARPEAEDPRVRAAALLLNRLGPPMYMVDPKLFNWVVLEGQRLWAEHGPTDQLVPVVCGATFHVFGQPEDFALRARVAQHALAVGEARGYQPASAHGEMLFALGSSAWAEPVERTASRARAARDTLLRHGEGFMACFAYTASLSGLLDFGSTLDDVATHADAAVALTLRVGQATSGATFTTYRQLVRALRGETSAPGRFADPLFDEDGFAATHLPANAYAVASLYINRALLAALRGDEVSLTRDADALAPLESVVTGPAYAHARLVRTLALAYRTRAGGPRQALDELCAWWARRAAEAPANYQHLSHLVEAERSWATGDILAALAAFDAAARAADARERPWHRAFIAERAARCHLGYGLERTGHELLAEARDRYARWGATAKVRELEAAYPFLEPPKPVRPRRSTVDIRHTGTVAADAVDMHAILRAVQALSAETSLDRLYATAADQLCALTGATSVALALYDRDSQRWFVPAERRVPLAEAGELLPLTAFRYAERTRETLLVPDAVVDDRFAKDPYLAGRERCSLLAVPILDQGALRAVLLLANDRTASAFTASGLDAVTLIAGQLAVCMDNALLYRSLEDRVAERTQELASANRQLEILSSTDALTKLANRRRFTEILDHEWARAVRTGEPLSVVVIDIDHFKRYNDAYGHLGGDECLRRVAAALREGAMRATDVVCRYGGEAFAIVLPDTGYPGAGIVAERIREAVAGQALPHELADSGQVTVSVGYATTVPDRAAVPETLVQAADGALREAKNRGRNRTCGALD
ncbi:MAG TPA: sensor domain-containing diguanylate cyclase, partial [Rugosimonospora sp.]|nr:sensor domain-containing diguanylate cyclase [Rugosimonospora sp.]